MKLQLASDIHSEFHDPDNPVRIDNHGSDALLLCGDVMVAASLAVDNRKYEQEFFARLSDDFENVYYIAGNHEHYSGSIETTGDIIREFLRPFDNIHFLENEEVHLTDETVLLAATFWTNFSRQDHYVMYAAQSMMNDYRQISTMYGKFLPVDSFELHIKSFEVIASAVEKNKEKDVVIMTHHAPSYMSCEKKFRYRDDPLSHAYASDMSDFILNNENIVAWCHGHVHNSNLYEIGQCLVLSNPYGYYGYETNPEFNPNLIIEVA